VVKGLLFLGAAARAELQLRMAMHPQGRGSVPLHGGRVIAKSFRRKQGWMANLNY